MVEVSVEEGAGPPVDPSALELDGQRILDAIGLPDTELSVVLADDRFVRPLNLEWRGQDAATDVLSFPQEEAESPGVFGSPPAMLGDVVISVETAARQAEELGHSLEVEVRALLIHGILHLVGHDHEDDEDGAAAMRVEEDRLHQTLGLPGSAALIRRAG